MQLLSRRLISFILLIGGTLPLAACSTGTALPDPQQALDTVWPALEPNTTSHNQAAWEVVEVQSLTGPKAQELFAGEPVPGGCAPGLPPPANAPIELDGSYWYIQLKPRYATPQPQPTERYSPTAPPIIPEPFVEQARFLVDAGTNQVVARKIHCVIY